MTELTTPQYIKVNSSSHSHNEEENELRQHSQNMPQSASAEIPLSRTMWFLHAS